MDKTKLMKKLDELTALAAAHDKRLEMTQVLDCFADEAVTPEEMEDVYARLGKHGGYFPQTANRWNDLLYHKKPKDKVY